VLRVTVSDNGAGMSEPALAQLRARLKESHIKENMHIGLCNVDMRIRLIFGEDYGVSVESREGMAVTVDMPKVRSRGGL